MALSSCGKRTIKFGKVIIELHRKSEYSLYYDDDDL